MAIANKVRALVKEDPSHARVEPPRFKDAFPVNHKLHGALETSSASLLDPIQRDYIRASLKSKISIERKPRNQAWGYV